MIDDGALEVLAIVLAVASGAVGGVFFAFSVFVMSALARLPAPQGIAAMQAINITVITPLFMLLLFGTGLGCAVLAVAAGLDWSEAGAPGVLVASLLYLLGVIAVTGAYNVPRNNVLAAVRPEAPEAGPWWATYLREWTRANHLRTIGGLGAAAILTTLLA